MSIHHWLILVENLHKHVHHFFGPCSHYIATHSLLMVLRLLSHSFHATKPSEMLWLDICFVRKEEKDILYVFVVKKQFRILVVESHGKSRCRDYNSNESALGRIFKRTIVLGIWQGNSFPESDYQTRCHRPEDSPLFCFAVLPMK